MQDKDSVFWGDRKRSRGKKITNRVSEHVSKHISAIFPAFPFPIREKAVHLQREYAPRPLVVCDEGSDREPFPPAAAGHLNGITEALCSFLQAGNVGNFQHCKDKLGVPTWRRVWVEKEWGIAASRDSVELCQIIFSTRVHPTYLSLKMGHTVPRFTYIY